MIKTGSEKNKNKNEAPLCRWMRTFACELAPKRLVLCQVQPTPVAKGTAFFASEQQLHGLTHHPVQFGHVLVAFAHD